MRAHVDNAEAVAAFLAADARVSWTRYAGLSADPQHELAARYFPNGAGSVFSFGLAGGRQAGRAFIEALHLCSHLANIGDAKTLVIHPASTTQQQLSAEALEASGVGADLVRISVGLEDVDDIIWDLDQALSAAQGAS
jgi:O-acetylhomoserine (thiol)-lyase